MTRNTDIAVKSGGSAPCEKKRRATSLKSPSAADNQQRTSCAKTPGSSTAAEIAGMKEIGVESTKGPGGKRSRRKGAVGQSTAANLMRDRDWVIDQITVGVSAGDLIGTDQLGGCWCIEVKNCAGILPGHLTQAREQAKRRGLPWMLMNKIAGTTCWLVRRQGKKPVIWEEK